MAEDAYWASFPKMLAVKDSNGELSMDVAESNRLREMLGLQPLRDVAFARAGKSAEAAAVENFAKIQSREAGARSRADVKARLEHAVKQRKLKEAIDGQTIADFHSGDRSADIDSAVEWVKRSRGASNQHQVAASPALSIYSTTKCVNNGVGENIGKIEKTGRLTASENTGSQDLTALRMKHSVNEIKRDMIDKDIGNVVMTIEDSSILNYDGTSLNNADDKLVSTSLTEAERSKQLRKRKAQSLQYMQAYEDEFETEEAASEAAKAYAAEMRTKQFMSPYNDDRGSVMVERATVESNKPQEFSARSCKKTEEISGKELIGFCSKVVGSEASDYLTVEDATRLRVKKKIRKKPKGYRNDGSIFLTKKYARSTEDSSRFLERKASPSLDINEDHDPNVSVYLSRARRLPRMRDTQDLKHQNEVIVNKYSKSLYKSLDQLPQEGLMESSGTDSNSRKGENLIVTTTCEFSSRLDAKLNSRTNAKPPNSSTETNVVEMEQATEARRYNDSSPSYVDYNQGARMNETDDSFDEGDEQIDFMREQPLANNSLTDAIGLFRSTGDLNSSAREEMQVGRAKDTRRFHDEKSEPDHDTRFNNIKIEHRDGEGRLLTRKEAFRQISYKFHGHGPKQRKTERRRKQLNELDLAQRDTGGVLQRALVASGDAFLPLSGGAASFAARKESFNENIGRKRAELGSTNLRIQK